MKTERLVIWHGMDEKFRNTSQELWVLFANNFSNRLEVRRITRILDVVEDEGWFFDDGYEVDFDSNLYVPIAWMSAFNQDALKTIEEDICDA